MKNRAKAAAKSLRWVANQIPADLGNSEEEKMLKCIKLYCQTGANVIEELISVNEQECPRCHQVLEPQLKLQGPHIGLYCKSCGKFVKWISKTEAAKLGFEVEEDMPF